MLVDFFVELKYLKIFKIFKNKFVDTEISTLL